MSVFNYSSASRYLMKRYNLNGRINGLGRIDLRLIEKVKTSVVIDHSIENIGLLKSTLNAQLDFWKQINLIIVVITFVLTSIFSLSTFYLQYQLKPIDWTHEIITILNKDYIESMSSIEEKAKYLGDNYNLEKSSYSDSLLELQKYHDKVIISIISIISPLLLLFAIALLRFRWISDAVSCLTGAFEEKMRTIEENDEDDNELSNIRKMILS